MTFTVAAKHSLDFVDKIDWFGEEYCGSWHDANINYRLVVDRLRQLRKCFNYRRGRSRGGAGGGD